MHLNKLEDFQNVLYIYDTKVDKFNHNIPHRRRNSTAETVYTSTQWWSGDDLGLDHLQSWKTVFQSVLVSNVRPSIQELKLG